MKKQDSAVPTPEERIAQWRERLVCTGHPLLNTLAKRRVTKPAIRVAICVDQVGVGGQTGEQEIETIKKRLTLVLKGRKVKFVYTGDAFSSLLEADLLFFDYGGMANAYSRPNTLSAYDYARMVCTWLRDHPSSLVVIGSTFSYDVLIERELRELGITQPKEDDPWGKHEHPPNLLVGRIGLHGDYKHLYESERMIRDWFFGVKKNART